MKRFVMALAMLIGCLWSDEVLAQACTVTVTDINFGTVTGLAGTTVDATGTFTATCNSTNGVLLCYHLGRGGGQGFGTGQRTIVNGGLSANIELYNDPGRTQVWRTVTAVANQQGTVPLIIPGGNGVTRSQTIYARMTIGTGAPGTYATPFDNFTDDRIIGDFLANIPVADRRCDVYHAAEAGRGFNITANVASYCDVTGGTLDFGTSGPLTTNLDAAGSLSVGCTNGTTYAVSLDNGQNAVGAQRRMISGGNAVTYDLYTDAARTQAWQGSTTATATGTGNTVTFPVYGRIPPQGAKPPGTYSDTVVVTMTY